MKRHNKMGHLIEGGTTSLINLLAIIALVIPVPSGPSATWTSFPSVLCC